MPLMIQNDGQMKAVTGLPESQLQLLEKEFARVYQRNREEQEKWEWENGLRERQGGGGRPSKLKTMREKLIFVLHYLKTYPSYQVLGAEFGLSGSRACQNVHALLPVLCDTLEELGVMPHRKFANPEEMKTALEGIEKLIIDVMERAHQRPQDNEEQREMYSGKKKRHMVKNTVISNPDKVILFLGMSFPGSHHDYAMLKEEFPPTQPWFSSFINFVDLGYLGICSDYPEAEIFIPHKKPRKSKSNPNPELTQEQRDENRQRSRIRVVVEHSIGGMRRYNILVHAFRNRIDSMIDQVVGIVAGLWNFMRNTSVPSLSACA